uniref:Uncharacterized protein n=1 Tax=Alloyangia mangrovi TaxID=1779329 RepID=A0A2A3K134_9RHOB
MLEEGLKILSELDENFRYDSSKIRVESITTSSLAWDLLVEVYGKYQTQIEDKVAGSIEEMFGVDIPQEYEGLVTLLALGATYMVARYGYERVTRSKESNAPSIHIHGENNVVIQQIGAIVGVDEHQVEKALERSLPPARRRALIPKVADFLRPARKCPGESIEMRNAPDISSDVLQEFPNDADLEAVDDSENVELEFARLDLRGTDRDRHKQGWGAAIVGDDRFPKRLPMDLYPTVDPDKLANHRSVIANLVVECNRGADGALRPKRIHLLSFAPIDHLA